MSWSMLGRGRGRCVLVAVLRRWARRGAGRLVVVSRGRGVSHQPRPLDVQKSFLVVGHEFLKFQSAQARHPRFKTHGAELILHQCQVQYGGVDLAHGRPGRCGVVTGPLAWVAAREELDVRAQNAQPYGGFLAHQPPCLLSPGCEEGAQIGVLVPHALGHVGHLPEPPVRRPSCFLLVPHASNVCAPCYVVVDVDDLVLPGYEQVPSHIAGVRLALLLCS